MLFHSMTSQLLEVQVSLPQRLKNISAPRSRELSAWTLHPGVNLDFIGSVVLAGDGLTDLLVAQGATDPEDTIWAYQTRLMVYIDQFMK